MEQLLGYRVMATDGSAGKVTDFLLLDDRWDVAWVVAGVNRWPNRRRVLLRPRAVAEISETRHRLFFALTREEVACSPDAETEKPVTRQKEILAARRYGWKTYRAPPPFRGVSLIHHRPEIDEDLPGSNGHLRSFRELTSYCVRGTRCARFLRDTVADDVTWAIKALIVSEGLLSGREASIVDPRRVKAIDWSARLIDLAAGDGSFAPGNAAETVELRMLVKSLGFEPASKDLRSERGGRFQQARNGHGVTRPHAWPQKS